MKDRMTVYRLLLAKSMLLVFVSSSIADPNGLIADQPEWALELSGTDISDGRAFYSVLRRISLLAKYIDERSTHPIEADGDSTRKSRNRFIEEFDLVLTKIEARKEELFHAVLCQVESNPNSMIADFYRYDIETDNIYQSAYKEYRNKLIDVDANALEKRIAEHKNDMNITITDYSLAYETQESRDWIREQLHSKCGQEVDS